MGRALLNNKLIILISALIITFVFLARSFYFSAPNSIDHLNKTAILKLTEDTDTAPGFPTPSNEDLNHSDLITNKSARIIPENFKEYRNPKYGFSIFYPKNLITEEFDDGGEAYTITFEDPEDIKGFQIFIAKYTAPQVSERRFKQDVPSGVIKEPVTGLLDGVLATKFFSEHELIGETVELWFIHNGSLFEITAPKTLDGWLSGIIKTWIFI